MSKHLTLLAVCAVLFSCSDSGSFSGNNKTEQPQKNKSAQAMPAQQTATSTNTSTNLQQPIAPASNIPSNAVTKGSFSVWTVPSNPAPKQAYQIFINIRLPNSVSTYQIQDLSGRVTGTDGYFRGIGRNSRGPFDPDYLTQKQTLYPGFQPIFENLPQDSFNFSAQNALVSISVPGAKLMVQDTIDVRSDILNESQQINIVFGNTLNF